MKQIGLGIVQYTQGADEKYPYRCTTPDGSDNDATSWKAALQPFIKSNDVFQCPDNPDKAFNDAGGAAPGPISYGPNTKPNAGTGGTTIGVFGTGCGGNGFYTASSALNDINTPATTIEVVEETYNIKNNGNFGCTDFNITDDGNFASTLFVGHTAMSNYLFCDGHVKSLRPLATVNSGNGGSGSTDTWDENGADISGGTTSGDGGNANTILTTAATMYKP